MINESGTKATTKEKGPTYMVALCRRCAELWRRYGIQWEDIDQVVKQTGQAGFFSLHMGLDDIAACPLKPGGQQGKLVPIPDDITVGAACAVDGLDHAFIFPVSVEQPGRHRSNFMPAEELIGFKFVRHYRN